MTKRQTQTGDEVQTETFWHLVHDQLTYDKPEHPNHLNNVPEGEEEGVIMCYQDYLNEILPRQKLEDGTYEPTIEEKRSKLQQSFARPGGPGAKFKNTLEKMIKALTLPKGAREELGISEDGTMPEFEDDQEEQKGEDDQEDDPAKIAE